MNKFHHVLLLLLWMLSLHGSGIFLFYEGFFLTRYEISDKSKCSDPPTSIPLEILNKHLKSTEEFETSSCWQTKQFERAIIIVIDAMRFEYAVYDENLQESNKNYYQNRLPILHYLLRERRDNCFLFNFRADPPTVTMQRLKGIVTGGMPTFIEIRQNFDSSAITEDSLVHQLIENKKWITFMGDDTWESLFPSYFNRSFPFPSFNVKDLHTVDDGVISHLVPEITSSYSKRDKTKGKQPKFPERNRNHGSTEEDDLGNRGNSHEDPHAWDVIIAHFLGVDHVGHRYQANHPAMTDKLAQMNKMIEEVVEVMEDDTLLLVMGDHGSTSDGDHGGASELELNAALFAYSKKPINDFSRTHFQGSSSNRFRTVNQIDLVPTLSLLLGVPIPFGNLGGIIPEFFLHSEATDLANSIGGLNIDEPSQLELGNQTLDSLKRANIALHINAGQIFRYLETYSNISAEFPQSLLQYLRTVFEDNNSLFLELLENEGSMDHNTLLIKHKSVFVQYREFQRQVTKMCRDIWVSFDLVSMLWGIAVLIFSVILILFQLSIRESVPFSVVPVLTAGAIGGFIISYALSFTSLSVGQFALFNLHQFLIGYAFISGFAHIFTSYRDVLTITEGLLIPLQSKETLYAILVTGLHGWGLFSNSFIEAEKKVVLFFVTTSVIVLIVSTFKNIKKTVVTFAGWQKRPETQTLSKLLVYAMAIKLSNYSTAGNYEPFEMDASVFLWECALPLIAVPVVLVGVMAAHPHDRSDTKKFLFAEITLTGIYWTIQKLGILDAWHHLGRIALPWAIYLLAIAGLYNIIRSPMKNFNGIESVQFLVSPILHMLAILYVPLMLISGFRSALAILALFVQTATFIEINVDLQRPKVAAGAVSFPYHTVILWAFFTIQYFFSTGHSFEFSKLHWGAAFVGLEEMSFIGGGILMVLETFSTTILLTMALPLLVARLTLKSSKLQLTVYEPFIKPMLTFLLIFALNATLTTGFVYTARRHLMVWRVFAPKFIFDCVFLLSIDAFVILSFCFVAWIFSCLDLYKQKYRV